MLHGNPILMKTMVSIKVMVKTIQNDRHGLSIQFQDTTKEKVKPMKEVELAIQDVLDQFEPFFAEL